MVDCYCLFIFAYILLLFVSPNRCKEPAEIEKGALQFPFDVMLAMGSLLECSDQGNVEFRFKNTPDGRPRSLYALNTILSARSGYYATSLSPS